MPAPIPEDLFGKTAVLLALRGTAVAGIPRPEDSLSLFEIRIGSFVHDCWSTYSNAINLLQLHMPRMTDSSTRRLAQK